MIFIRRSPKEHPLVGYADGRRYVRHCMRLLETSSKIKLSPSSQDKNARSALTNDRPKFRLLCLQKRHGLYGHDFFAGQTWSRDIFAFRPATARSSCGADRANLHAEPLIEAAAAGRSRRAVARGSPHQQPRIWGVGPASPDFQALHPTVIFRSPSPRPPAAGAGQGPARRRRLHRAPSLFLSTESPHSRPHLLRGLSRSQGVSGSAGAPHWRLGLPATQLCASESGAFSHGLRWPVALPASLQVSTAGLGREARGLALRVTAAVAVGPARWQNDPARPAPVPGQSTPGGRRCPADPAHMRQAFEGAKGARTAPRRITPTAAGTGAPLAAVERRPARRSTLAVGGRQRPAAAGGGGAQRGRE